MDIMVEEKKQALTKNMFDAGLKRLRMVIKGDINSAIGAAIDAKVPGVIDTAIGSLAIKVEKGFAAITKDMTKQSDLLALTTRVDKMEKYMENRFDDLDRELKDIRGKIAEADCRADVVDLQIRMSAVEKKAKLRLKG
jgi:hypothetical protein